MSVLVSSAKQQKSFPSLHILSNICSHIFPWLPLHTGSLCPAFIHGECLVYCNLICLRYSWETHTYLNKNGGGEHWGRNQKRFEGGTGRTEGKRNSCQDTKFHFKYYLFVYLFIYFNNSVYVSVFVWLCAAAYQCEWCSEVYNGPGAEITDGNERYMSVLGIKCVFSTRSVDALNYWSPTDVSWLGLIYSLGMIDNKHIIYKYLSWQYMP